MPVREREKIQEMLRKRSLILIAVLLFASPCFAAYVPGQLFVKFRAGIVSSGNRIQTVSLEAARIDSSSIRALNAKHRVISYKQTVKKEVRVKKLRSGKTVVLPDLSNIYLLELPKDVDIMAAAEDYRKDPSVEYASPNYIYKLFVVPQDPDYIEDYTVTPNQWGLYRIGLRPVGIGGSAWDYARGTSEVKVAVIDTGINYFHEELKNRVNSAEGWDFVNNDAYALDDFGHGTHVAGIIGAETDNAALPNGRGIAGVDWYCRLIPIKAFNSAGEGNTSDICNALDWAAGITSTTSADVINMSFGSYYNDPVMHNHITSAWSAGCVLVAAAGNENTSLRSYPAGWDEVVAVAATRFDDTKASYSNFGDWVDVCAPGGDDGTVYFDSPHEIFSTYYNPASPANDTYRFLEGTSMATPFVSGACALIISKYPSATNSDVVDLLKTFTKNIDAKNPGYVGLLGAGRIIAIAPFFGSLEKAGLNRKGWEEGEMYGVVPIIGSATGEGFRRYRVEVRGEKGNTSWTTLEDTDQPKYKDTIATFDSTGSDDSYTFRILVTGVVTVDGVITTATIEDTLLVKAGSKLDPLIIGRADYGPNPFNPRKGSIMIKYDLNRNSDTYIYFYNVAGQLICRKFYGWSSVGGAQGTNRVYWDGRDDYGDVVANGVYLFKVVSEDRVIGKGKIIVLK